MFTLLSKWFIKDNKNYNSPVVREKYGMLSGILGIILNALLFGGKFTAGILTGSISVTADAFNNLTDAGSSLITFIGFKLSSKPTDREHPFGHGRMEYIAGFLVSIIIFIVAFELIKSSIAKLIHPEAIEFSYVVLIILGVSILVKLYMFFYNRNIAKKINSATMRATATDCISDCIATFVVALSLIANKLWGWKIDGISGLLVALFILVSGYKSAKETIGLLLGEAPDGEYVSKIEKVALAQPGIIGVHDLMVHNYGPGRQFISLHAEVSSKEDVNLAHDQVDNAEKALEREFGCIAVLHTDPIVVDDPKRNELEKLTKEKVKEVNPEFSIHDFRITVGETHTNLVFDVTIPHNTGLTEKYIRNAITEKIKNVNESYNVVCKIEHSFSGRN